MISPVFSLAYSPAIRSCNDGQYLRMAGGAMSNIIWQAAHLGVAAFAGVFAKSVWKVDYLLERLQDSTL
jgi:hypothetical protein